MSYLTLDADKLVRDAVDAYLEGRLRSETEGDCIYATRNSQYRVVEGTVHEASDPSLIGAELVAWLAEELGQPNVESRWRPYARAIFVERRSRHVVVTSRTLTRTTVAGNPPAPRMKRRPSVIPNAPPIPVLRTTPPPGDGSPTPFRVPETVKQMAADILASDKPTTRPPPPEASRNETPTSRPPAPDEHTVSADRASYDALLDASRTPTGLHLGDAPAKLAPPAVPGGSGRLPPVSAPPRKTPLGPGAAIPPPPPPPPPPTVPRRGPLPSDDLDERTNPRNKK